MPFRGVASARPKEEHIFLIDAAIGRSVRSAGTTSMDIGWKGPGPRGLRAPVRTAAKRTIGGCAAQTAAADRVDTRCRQSSDREDIMSNCVHAWVRSRM